MAKPEWFDVGNYSESLTLEEWINELQNRKNFICIAYGIGAGAPELADISITDFFIESVLNHEEFSGLIDANVGINHNPASPPIEKVDSVDEKELMFSDQQHILLINTLNYDNDVLEQTFSEWLKKERKIQKSGELANLLSHAVIDLEALIKGEEITKKPLFGEDIKLGKGIKPYTKDHLKDWQDYHLLAVVDLLLWGLITHTEYSDYKIDKWVYDDNLGADITTNQYTLKKVKKWANDLFFSNGIEQLKGAYRLGTIE